MPRQQDGCREIDGDLLAEGLGLALGVIARQADPGVVDHGIKPAEAVDDGRDDPGGGVGVGEVGG